MSGMGGVDAGFSDITISNPNVDAMHNKPQCTFISHTEPGRGQLVKQIHSVGERR